MSPGITLRWDSTDFLCMIKKLLSFVQESREKWDGIAWEQVAKVKCEAIDPNKGETEAENINKGHVAE